MFIHPHPDGVLAVAPALAMLTIAVAAFLPGRVMLDRVDRMGWAAPPPAEPRG